MQGEARQRADELTHDEEPSVLALGRWQSLQREVDDGVSREVAGPDQSSFEGVSPDQPAIPESSDQVKSGSAPHACVIGEQIPIRTRSIYSTDKGVGMRTDVDITWQPANPGEIGPPIPYCACSCGEYRQYVKGHILRNGVSVEPTVADGATLEESTWHEDGPKTYGHRDRDARPGNAFAEPDRDSGCHFHAWDYPEVYADPGDTLDVDVQFKGQTYDKCLERFGPIREWSFAYKGILGTDSP
jgi:hypothetical protein